MWLKESIKQRRISLGLNVKEAALKIGISNSLLHYIETGQRAPSLETLRLIAIAYKVPMWVFLYCSDDGVAVGKTVQPAYKSLRASTNQLVKELL